MADNLLDEWIERLEYQCDEADKVNAKRSERDGYQMVSSIAPASLWRARIVAIRKRVAGGDE